MERHAPPAQPLGQTRCMGQHPRLAIENFFLWAGQFRAIATRHDKTARNFLAAFHMAAVLCWLN